MQNTYDPLITLWKFAQIGIMGALGALIAHFGNLPPTETVLVTIAVLKAAQNYLKNA